MSDAPRKLRLPIPTHVICGSLASGKTSTLLSLLRAKQDNAEVWAVLVNEFGALGIDAATLDGAGAAVRELAGGCLCCAMPTVTAAALVQLVRSSKPDRLIVEPSGLAHPTALLRLLRGPHLASALDIRPITCLVDLSTFNPEKAQKSAENDDNSIFLAQIEVADTLIGTKADLCSEERVQAFYRWSEALAPPKTRFLVRKTSEISAEDVGMAAAGESGERTAVEVASQGPGRPGPAKKVWLSNATTEEASATPGRPLRKEGGAGSSEAATCGWVFHSDDVFRADDLSRFVRESIPAVLRLKGIFRIGLKPPRWVLASVAASSGSADNGAAEEQVLQELPEEQRDSRVEVIVAVGGGAAGPSGEGGGVGQLMRDRDWAGVERALIELLEKN